MDSPTSAASAVHKVVRLLRLIENRRCADCSVALGEGKSVYACQAFCVFICKGCAEIHNSLPLEADEKLVSALAGGNSWNEESIAQFQKAGSNIRVNKVLERHAPANWQKPTAESSLLEKESWIRAKYNKLFMLPLPASQALPFSAPSSSAAAGGHITSLVAAALSTQHEEQQQPQHKSAPTLPIRIADFFVSDF